MKARSSVSVEFLPPTSPISPPTEMVMPFGSSPRMKAVSSAQRRVFSACCSGMVALLKSTSVLVSTSML